jgi:branched-chain amino acid transport system substrate-binding protein
MKRLLICALLIAAPALAQQAAQVPTLVPTLVPITVGAVMPQSGNLADLAADLRKALLLWQEEVNAGGGLLGRRVELRLLDDRSESIETRKLYEQLILEHKADLLIGPLGSAASLGAAAVAERNRRVLMNATGTSRTVHKPGYRYVFQSATPLSAYGIGALEFARSIGLKRVVLLAHDDPVSREIAVVAREGAVALGLAAGDVETYPQGTTDFAVQVARARASGAEGWIAFGLPQDAAEMVKSMRRLAFAPRLFIAQGAADPGFIKRVGQDAEYAVGISAYDRGAATRGNAQFVLAYAKKWSAEPGQLAAEGYAAAKVLEEAVRRAGSIDQEKLCEALAALETETPLGPYKVDRTGAQVGARPLLLQIIRGRRQIIWPEALETAKWQPFPTWDARKPMK